MSMNPEHSGVFIATNHKVQSYFQLVHSGTVSEVALIAGAVHFTKELLKAVICGRHKLKE